LKTYEGPKPRGSRNPNPSPTLATTPSKNSRLSCQLNNIDPHILFPTSAIAVDRPPLFSRSSKAVKHRPIQKHRIPHPQISTHNQLPQKKSTFNRTCQSLHNNNKEKKSQPTTGDFFCNFGDSPTSFAVHHALFIKSLTTHDIDKQTNRVRSDAIATPNQIRAQTYNTDP